MVLDEYERQRVASELAMIRAVSFGASAVLSKQGGRATEKYMAELRESLKQ